jgi:hypothetical protein
MAMKSFDKAKAQRIFAAFIGSSTKCPVVASTSAQPSLKMLLDEVQFRSPGKKCMSWNIAKAREFLTDHPRTFMSLNDVIPGTSEANVSEDVPEVCLGGGVLPMAATPVGKITGKRARLASGDEHDADNGVSDEDFEDYVPKHLPPGPPNVETHGDGVEADFYPPAMESEVAVHHRLFELTDWVRLVESMIRLKLLYERKDMPYSRDEKDNKSIRPDFYGSLADLFNNKEFNPAVRYDADSLRLLSDVPMSSKTRLALEGMGSLDGSQMMLLRNVAPMFLKKKLDRLLGLIMLAMRRHCVSG